MPLKLILLIVALVQAGAPAILFFNGFNPSTGRPPTPIVPADYAFTIWSLIYGLAVLFSGAQVLSRPVNGALQRILVPATSLFLLSTIWLLCARYGPAWATVPIIIGMLSLATYALLSITDHPPDQARFADWLAVPLFGLYAGWLSVAVFANFTEIAADLGFNFFGLALEPWTLLALVLATGLACGIAFRSRGSLFFAAAVLWAFAAIAVANAAHHRPILAASAMGAAAVMIGVTSLAKRRLAKRSAGRSSAV